MGFNLLAEGVPAGSSNSKGRKTPQHLGLHQECNSASCLRENLQVTALAGLIKSLSI